MIISIKEKFFNRKNNILSFVNFKYRGEVMFDILKGKKAYVVLSALLCLVTVFGVYQYNKARRLEYSRELEYNRVFSELTEYVDDLEISLLKGQIAHTPAQISKLSSELYRQASAAKANLALLPLENIQLEKTSEFLSQVGEYSNSISRKALRGEVISEKEHDVIKRLTEYASHLKEALDRMLVGINDGDITFSENTGKLRRVMRKTGNVSAQMQNLEEEFHDYPSLIYDGPFSQHLNLKEAVFVKGKTKITQTQAKKRAQKFIGEKKCSVNKIEGTLPSYSVEAENVTVEYTKEGGVLLLYMKDRLVDEEKISFKKAKEYAKKFLDENGFSDMRESYYEKMDGSVVINYAYYQDEYMVFPDLVKVKVALDNGEIIGFESRGYIMNHQYRDIPSPVITEEEALEKVNKSLKIKNVTRAVIPLESGEEAFCYQIKGIVGEKHFLVYVNTQTGMVEDMQILLESENGTLAV